MKTITKNYPLKTVTFFTFLFLILLVPIHSNAQFSGGNGTYESPFEISNLTDLRFLSENDEHWDKHFVLTQDIDASNTTTWNSGRGFSPIGDSPNGLRQKTPFTGYFNGLGYNITSIHSNRPGESFIGFFGYIEDAIIENLKLTNVDLTGENGAAGLVVESRSSKIKNCHVSGKVSDFGQNTTSGGLIGISLNSDVAESYAMVEVSATIAGGFIGVSNSDQINDCWAGGIIDGSQISGGFVGVLDSGTLKNCYAIGEVNGQQLAGGFCGFNDSSGNITNSFFDLNSTRQSQAVGQGDGQGVTALDTGDFSIRQNFVTAGWKLDEVWEMSIISSIDNVARPYLKMQLAPYYVHIRVLPEPAASVSGIGYYKPNEQVNLGYTPASRYTFSGWLRDGNVVSTANPHAFTITESQTYNAIFTEDTAFEGGDGTAANPYQIANVNQLQDINTIPSLLNRHYVLTADIDASPTKSWNNGKGFIPIGNQNRPFTGSFDGNGNLIKNLHINRLGESGIGLFGYTHGATITKVGLDNVNISGKNQTAGFVGQDIKSTKISLSYVTGLITGNSEVGGFLGNGIDSGIDNSYSLARTYGKDAIGGMAGYLSSSGNTIVRVNSSYTAGRILSDATAGAIVSHIGRNVSPRSIYDRNTTGLQKGTNSGDGGAEGYSTDRFSYAFLMNQKFDMVNLWQFAYGQDGIKRPILKWENPFVFNLSDDGNGTIDKEPIERILPGVDFPPITAYPNEGHTFGHWLDEDTQEQWTSNPLNINQVDRNYNLKAVFVPNVGNRKVKITVINTVQVPVANALLEWEGNLFRTDSNGVVELSGVSDGTYSYIISHSSSYVPLNDILEVNGSDVDIQVVLYSGTEFKDQNCTFLVTEGALPISNAQIVIQKQGETPQTFFTDSFGEFTFTGNGVFEYTVSVPGYETKTDTFTLSTNNLFKRIALSKVYDLELTVTDGANVLPMAEITFDGITYQANNQGVVLFQDLVNDTYNFLVSASGFTSIAHSSTIQGNDLSETIVLAPPTGPLRAITIRVTDGLRTIENAGIIITGPDILFTNTNAQGEALVQLVDGSYTLRVFAAPYGTVEPSIVVTKDDIIEIVLSGPTVNIRLSVGDFNGNPIPNATVEFYGRSLTTDANGLVTIFNLVQSATYEFTVSATGYLPNTIKILVDPTVTFYSIPLAKPASVTFECSDGTMPLAGVQLDLEGKQYISDSQGQIHIPNLRIRQSAYRYFASIDGYHSQSGGFVLSSPTYTGQLVFVQKTSQYDVDFRVEDVMSSPILYAEILLEGNTYYTDANGMVVIGKMPDGRYPFTVNALGYQTVKGSLFVNGNAVTETVVLQSQNQPTFNVLGTVTDNNGNPLENVILNGFSTTVTTDTNGRYSAEEVQGWSGNIRPTLQNYTFSPTNVSVNNLLGDLSGNDFVGTPTVNQFSVSGTVKDINGNPLQNAVLSGFSNAVTTNANGEFSVLEAVGWSGTIAVSLPGYSFSPTSIQINALQGDDSGNDFVGTRIVHQISGMVKDDKGNPLSNVTVSGFGFSITTDVTGRYWTSRQQDWSGNISVSLPGYTFTPTDISINNLQGDSTNNDFIGTPIINRYSISGTVTDNSGGPLENVVLSGFSTSVTTNANGQYSAMESQGWSGSISASLQGYTFSPSMIQVSNLQADSNGNDFTGTAVTNRFTVSGTVTDNSGSPLENVILSGFSTSVTTNANGQYSATENQGWSGSISTSLQGYTFSPSARQVSNLQADSSGNDFTGTAVTNRFTVSGTVTDNDGAPLENVILIGFSTSVTTNANGQYSATESQGWSGSISASLQGYTFSPSARQVSNIQVDSTGNNFIGTVAAKQYTISGTVRDKKGNPLENVILSGFSSPVTTNANGEYSVTENENWSGSIVPSFEDLVFTPQLLTITNLNEDVSQNFKGEESLNMFIFPNPSYDGNFTVILPKVDGIKQLQIFTPSGQLVHSTVLEDNVEAHTLENVLPSGMYILKLTVKDGIYEQKILIN
ncbi:T9SS type A sorting domain-containing protein [Flagellimonas sp. HMM57]|uniref:carboxypeptidase regulatory-like domain-containing protein n=1 Tax=unclassified Flagellimonas TaxID=2644544 RepID=UPI0013D307E6|nr:MULTISPECIES: carboxypeptidase regulatory-like domain-containing protein [unclassified Flagellimonas]UII75807.1 T9SS type A sorting domain-containing protein [Flagellimonas sp. HMM57]